MAFRALSTTYCITWISRWGLSVLCTRPGTFGEVWLPREPQPEDRKISSVSLFCFVLQCNRKLWIHLRSNILAVCLFSRDISLLIHVFCGIGPGLQRSERLLCALFSAHPGLHFVLWEFCVLWWGRTYLLRARQQTETLLAGILPPAVARLPGSQPRAHAAPPTGFCSPLPLSLC